MPSSTKIIIDSAITGDAARYGAWDIFKLSLEGALLTASGDATDAQVTELTALDEWLVTNHPGHEIGNGETQYVSEYNTIMDR